MLPSLVHSFVGQSSIRELCPPAYHELTADLLLPFCHNRIRTHTQPETWEFARASMPSCLWRMELSLPTDLGRLVSDLFYQKWRPLLLKPCLFWRVSKMTRGNMLSIDVIFPLVCWLVINVVAPPHKHWCRDEKWSTRAAPQHFLSKKGMFDHWGPTKLPSRLSHSNLLRPGFQQQPVHPNWLLKHSQSHNG